MKLFLNQKKLFMKKIIIVSLAFVCFLTASAEAQSKFIRIYSSAGTKIAKGQLVAISDSGLTIYSKDKYEDIPYQNISYIKTRHEIGNGALVGALSVGVPVAILGAADGASSKKGTYDINFFTGGELALFGFIAGGITGSLAGMGISALQTRKTFFINGNQEGWVKAKAQLQLLMNGNK